MVIRVEPGAADTICHYADGFVIQVTQARDVEAAIEALMQARVEIAALSPFAGEGPESPTVSRPVLAPGGPLLRVVGLDVDEQRLRSIPDLVVASLERVGVADARIETPEPGGRLDGLDLCPNAVILRLFPEPAGADGNLPARWIDTACEWVLGDLDPTDTVGLRLLSVEFEVAVADAPAALHQAGQAGAWCDLVSGRLDERVRTASVTFGRAPHIALGSGGPSCDSAALLARFDLLCDVALDMGAEVAYACVDIESSFEGIGLGLAGDGWRDHGGASPNLVAGELVDELVPDVFPFQILSAGHLRRLASEGSDPAEGPIGVPLAGGGAAVSIGDAADWLPFYDTREDVQAEGFELLAPLLATEAEVEERLLARGERRDTRGAEEGTAGPSPSGTPDLADIVLEARPHARRGLRLSFLELVSWLAHEPHSDSPAAVSPVLATYARWFASALGEERRQELKSRARAAIGTAATTGATRTQPGAPLPEADAKRAWLTTDWLIRVQAAAWMRLAGLDQAADRLEAIGPTTDHLDLVRAVDLLSSAITTSSRRIELTASIAGSERAEDAELVEQAAWEAWECASELAGWVAASETASVGVPSDLAYTTDLRVIECARDPSVREELESSHRSIGDSAWSAALQAVADQAWARGWAAARESVDATAVVPLDTARDRASRAASTRAGMDEDARDEAFDAADVAAKAVLTRAALGLDGWMSDDHPWDAARAAATTESTGLWSSVQELTRAAVDETVWDAGMDAARAAVDEVLHDAPNLVARAVGAAMAREAAGTSARAAAMRTAAVARAHGGDVAAVNDAALSALVPTATSLQDAAFALLDVLIAVPAGEPPDGNPGT